LHLLNYSGLALEGAVNRRSVTVRDRAALRCHVGAVAEIQLRTTFRGRSYQAYAGTVALEPAGRVVLLLLPPYHPGALQVQSRVLVDPVRPAAVEPRR